MKHPTSTIEPRSRPSPAEPLCGATPGTGTPDPLVTASVYCSGRLDELVLRSIHPFWCDLLDRDEGTGVYLWWLRYARGGEHLKVRVHGPDATRSTVRSMLQRHVESYLTELGPGPADARQHGRNRAAPVDLEDSALGNRPDREFLWTQYRRSPVSLGYGPFLEDEAYLARLTLCFGRGAELLLDRLVKGTGAGPAHGTVLVTLLHGLIHALQAVGFPPEKREAYFRYHRDWLLRAALKQSGRDPSPQSTREILGRFDQRIEGLGGVETKLARQAAAVWEGVEEAPGDMPTKAWRRALAGLARYAETLRRAPEYRVDPFTDDPCEVALFKVLNLFANQAGSSPLNEAFTHHLLYAATCAPARRHEPVRLVPDSPARSRPSDSRRIRPVEVGGEGGPAVPEGESLGIFDLELDVVARSGPEGRRWVDAFRASEAYRQLKRTRYATDLLRRYGIESGDAVLEEIRARLDAVSGTPAGLQLARRWYLSGCAYREYRARRFDEAEHLLDLACEELVSALNQEAFLLPFAAHFPDFDIQKARIARERFEWDAVRRHLDRARSTFAGEAPLCVLDDGSVLTMKDVRAFFAEFLPADDRKEQVLAKLDGSAEMDRLERGIYTLWDFVVPYP